MPTRIRRSITPLLALALAGLFFTGRPAAADQGALVVAISPDIPPYVTGNATGGLEVDLVAAALGGRALRFVQMPYRQLQAAVPQRRADVSAGVQQLGDGAFYSRDFIAFVNYAISKKIQGLKIDRVSDLAPYRVLAWQNACLELGSDFAALFAPGAPRHAAYVEVADQADQVRRFWEDPGAVIVIDRSIFAHFSAALGHSPEEVALHPVFPPATGFKAAFRDPDVRDRFDEGLARLCRDGAYARLLARHGVDPAAGVCD